MSVIRFDQITAQTPTYEHLTSVYAEFETQITSAGSADALAEAVARWDAQRREYDTYGALAQLHFEQDTRNADYKKAREYYDELNPKVIELDTKIKRILLELERRAQIEPRHGAQAFALWEAEVMTYDPVIRDELVTESKLEAEYTELLASAELPFDGATYNLSAITKFRQVADRRMRHDAETVLWDWFDENGTTLDRIYDEMTRLRHSMATKLGFDNFVGMGYKRMTRVDYDAADVVRYRDAVREYVVPLATSLRQQQAERIGVEKLMFWDEAMYDERDNPKPKGGHDWMIDRLREMFAAMGGPLGEFFGVMARGGFLDLKIRNGKAGGGFCTSFSSYGIPFIFANFNGTKSDVEVFTHEMGHAYQCYESRGQTLLDYFWPTYESCEIHSMGLEFLTWPHMEKFFGEDAERFRTIHLTNALLFLPYGVAVDHFQHLIYEDPDATPDRRHAMWREMEALYLPWRDYGDLGYPSRGGRWQLQRHIYGMPFYYIDYTLAQTCALQFWLLAQEDERAAMETYVALCKRGGEAPFQDLVRGAGLKSPFEPGCLEDVVGKARERLGV